jgi:hypothetical protein
MNRRAGGWRRKAGRRFDEVAWPIELRLVRCDQWLSFSDPQPPASSLQSV